MYWVAGRRSLLALFAIPPQLSWAINCDDRTAPAGPEVTRLWLVAVVGAIALSLVRRAWNPASRWKLRTFKIGMSLVQIAWWATLFLFISVSLLCTATGWPLQTWLIMPVAIEMVFDGTELLKRRFGQKRP